MVCTLYNARHELVWPGRFVPLNCHCSDGAGVPEMAEQITTVFPARVGDWPVLKKTVPVGARPLLIAKVTVALGRVVEDSELVTSTRY